MILILGANWGQTGAKLGKLGQIIDEMGSPQAWRG